MYRARYWNNAYFDALDILRPVASKLGVTEVECALRWMTHHSKLKGEFGDGIIIGASSPEQLEQNLKALEDQKISTNGYNHSLRCWMGEGEGHQW